jgi:glycosyltransferase involved in cell wall biosynthesis
MKILWFTNTPSLYDQGKHHYYGGGWIESLEEIIRKRQEIELAVSFFHPTNYDNEIRNGVHYYPILRLSAKRNPIRTILNNWRGNIEETDYCNSFKEIVEKFNPDVIQVFGTEGPFALIQELTEIPVVVHLQGLINPIVNTYFPVGYSKWDFLFYPRFLIKNVIGSSYFFNKKRFQARAFREKQILSRLQFVCGRTEWDRQIATLYNPRIRYFHVDEVLRPVFYEKSLFVKTIANKKFIILSTLSPTIYKGIDVVLKTAKTLKELTDIDFEWRIIGLESKSELLQFFQKKVGVDCESIQIKLLGKMSPEKIINHMLESDVFVHPSYIDNSPNSVCEAQMIGLPVIACNVGGVNSLIDHKQNGILVPSNGIFELVYYLKLLSENNELKSILGEKGKEKALFRHDKERIVERLLAVYKEIH